MIRNIRKDDAALIQKICDISLGYKVSVELISRQNRKVIKRYKPSLHLCV